MIKHLIVMKTSYHSAMMDKHSKFNMFFFYSYFFFYSSIVQKPLKCRKHSAEWQRDYKSLHKTTHIIMIDMDRYN